MSASEPFFEDVCEQTPLLSSTVFDKLKVFNNEMMEKLINKRKIRQELNNVFQSSCSIEISSNKTHIFESVMNDQWQTMNSEFLPEMEWDDNLDVKETISRLNQKCLSAIKEVPQYDEINRLPIFAEDVPKQISSYDQVVKQLVKNLANTEISGELDATGKKSVELEENIHDLKYISSTLNDFIAIKSLQDKKEHYNSEESGDNKLLENVENLLLEVETLLYSINCEIKQYDKIK